MQHFYKWSSKSQDSSLLHLCQLLLQCWDKGNVHVPQPAPELLNRIASFKCRHTGHRPLRWILFEPFPNQERGEARLRARKNSFQHLFSLLLFYAPGCQMMEYISTRQALQPGTPSWRTQSATGCPSQTRRSFSDSSSTLPTRVESLS